MDTFSLSYCLPIPVPVLSSLMSFQRRGIAVRAATLFTRGV